MQPEYLVLYVTDACNLACLHCFYYEDLNKARSIKPANLEKLANSIDKVVNVTFTGGEPFVMNDLPDTVRLFHERSGMEVATIPTNGILIDKVLQGVEAMCRDNPELILNISISLDGLEETHDYIRARKGGYRKSLMTLTELCALKKQFSNLNVGVITTINEANEDEIIPLFKQINGELDINQFLVNFIRGDVKELQSGESTLRKFVESQYFIHEKLLKGETTGHDIFMKDLYSAVTMRTKKTVLDTLLTNSCQTQCYAGTTNAIIQPDGKVQACEIRTDVEMGDLNDFDWDLPRLIASHMAQAVRKDILPSDCFCSFECQASSNTSYNPKELALSVIDMLRMKIGLMNNHFEANVTPNIDVVTGLRHKDVKGRLSVD